MVKVHNDAYEKIWLKLIYTAASAMKRGRMEGIGEGMEKGVMKTALAMLMDYAPISLIAKYTGLTIDEIRKLENQLRKD
ncbi:MAG: hypothetical protein LBU15_04545 [Rickettsiales bacterium]|jgi:hypothetical protein|nr:hypothetical protein [Rickettsiales bacterium]